MKRLSLAVLLAAALSIGAASFAHAATLRHNSDQSRADVVDYWTNAKMKEAKPVQRAKPNGNAARTVPYPFTALTPSQPYTSHPTNTNGKVYFTEGRTNYVCSGTALTSGNKSVVWTAGHCVNSGSGAFHTNWMFVPAYLNGATPYGKFTATSLFTTTGWSNSSDFRYDLGAATVGTSSTTNTALTTALGGGRALRTGASVLASPNQYTLYGYPAAKPFNGQTLRGCRAGFGLFDPYSSAPKPIGVGCDMTGGSSGGAWLNPAGEVVSVNSFGYTQLKNVMFGPQQGAEAQSLYATAAAG